MTVYYNIYPSISPLISGYIKQLEQTLSINIPDGIPNIIQTFCGIMPNESPLKSVASRYSHNGCIIHFNNKFWLYINSGKSGSASYLSVNDNALIDLSTIY